MNKCPLVFYQWKMLYAPQLFLISYRHAFRFDCENLIIFFLFHIDYRTGKQRIANFYFTKRMKCGTMKRKKTVASWIFYEKKATSKKNLLNRSQKSLNILWIFLKRLFLVSMLLGPLVMFIEKTFVNSIILVTCLVDFVLQGSWLISSRIWWWWIEIILSNVLEVANI